MIRESERTTRSDGLSESSRAASPRERDGSARLGAAWACSRWPPSVCLLCQAIHVEHARRLQRRDYAGRKAGCDNASARRTLARTGERPRGRTRTKRRHPVAARSRAEATATSNLAMHTSERDHITHHGRRKVRAVPTGFPCTAVRLKGSGRAALSTSSRAQSSDRPTRLRTSVHVASRYRMTVVRSAASRSRASAAQPTISARSPSAPERMRTSAAILGYA